MKNNKTPHKKSVNKNPILKKVVQARVAALFTLVALMSTAVFSSTSGRDSFQNLLFGVSSNAANLFNLTTGKNLLPQQSQSTNYNEASNSFNFEPALNENPTPQTEVTTVTTDRTDYNPGETVVITGSGFALYETVSLEIKRESVVAATFQATANENGNLINREFIIGANDIGASFVLKATGMTSGKTAESNFTDGTMSYTPVEQSYTNASAIVSNPTLSQQVSFNQTVIGANGSPQVFTVTPNIVRQSFTSSGITYAALPANYTVNVNPSSLSYCNGGGCNNSQQWLVTITVPANAVPIGQNPVKYSVFIRATPNTASHLEGAGTRILLEVKAPTTTDTTAPTTSVTSGNYINNSRTNQNVTVNLSASDNAGGVGVQNLTYTVTGPNGIPATTMVTSSPFTTSIPVSAEGNTTIQYSAKDFANNTENTKTFYVNIDKTAPVLSLPADITTPATAANGAVVNYVATATDISPANPTVTCLPTSGSVFSIGQTTVNCSATDEAGNTANGSFKVTVTKINQTITFAELGSKVYGDADFAVSATASSNLPVSFAAVGYCTLSGSTVHISGAGNCTITASQAGDATYSAAAPVSHTFTVNKKTLTPNITAGNKIYDGTTAATILTRTLTGIVGTDDVSLTGGTATFADPNAGNGKIVTVIGLSLSGTSAGNYTLASTTATTTANITAKALTANITAANKVYDGTTAATISTCNLVGVISGETVTCTVTATFDTKDAGTGKTVSATGLSLSGANAGNYTVNPTATTTANITAKTLKVSAAGVNKIYDGTTNATVTLSDDRIAGDIFTASYASASFADKNVSNGKTVSVSGISILGTDAGNYSANTSTATTANITQRTLNVTATGINRVYDGTAIATVNLIGNGVSGDNVVLGYTASFANKAVGAGKAVSVTGIAITGGTDAGNYTLGNTTASTSADITPKALTVTAAAASKQYDGNDGASVTLTIQAGGVIGSDAVGTSFNSAVFDNKNVGTGKTVTVSGIALTGADGGNYSANITATATANITAKALTAVVSVDNKIYDATTAATISNRSLTGVITPDVVSLSGGAAAFVDKNVGSSKTVNITGLNLTGTDAGNYSISGSATATANITPKTLTAAAAGVNKEYDATTTATVTLSGNQITGDTVTLGYTAASFANKNVGADKPVSVSGISITGGADGGNYTLGNTTASTTANIIAKSLTVTATGKDKEYDGNANAGVTLSDNRISGDVLTAAITSALFNNKNVGAGKPISVTGISISGTDAGNYSLANTAASATANITAKALTVIATGINKVYDTTTTATVTLSIAGAVSNDAVSANYGSALFADKNVGVAKIVTVSGITLSGADAGNYSANPSTTTTANITGVTVTGKFTAGGKIYDGTTMATITGGSLTGVIGNDIVNLNGGTATFDNKNVGTGKIVSANGFNLSGADAGNYILAAGPLTTTASISARSLVVSASGVNKIYDGNVSATVNLSTDKLSGDDVSAAFTTAAFVNKVVGTGKAVSVSGISISGADAGNYTFNTTASTTADITAKALIVSAEGKSKVYDGNTNATVKLSDNRVSGDVFETSYVSASFNNENAGTVKPVSISGISIAGFDTGNYTFNTTASTTADITALAITGSITAAGKVYDGTATAAILTRTLSGVISGDVVNYVSNISGTADFNDKNVGTDKTVTATGLELSGADAGNYSVNPTATTTANITKATVTVTALDAAREYGSNNPTFNVSFSNFVNGEMRATSGISGTPNCLTTATAASPASPPTYPISCTAGNLVSGNYNFNFLNGVLTVTKATLTVTANNKSREYGIANPVLDGNIIGIKNGDNITATYTTAVTPASLVGTYNSIIVPTLVDDPNGKLSNYTISINNGTLTVTARMLSVTEIAAPMDPQTITTTINPTANVISTGVAGNLTAVWSWGDNTITTQTFVNSPAQQQLNASHLYTAAGVYPVTLTVKDFAETTVTVEFRYIVIYDPDGGFVTGGGWINSPAGASVEFPLAIGKANFGFVSKYQKGNTVPTGNTEFHFKAGNLKFNSTSYDWLTIAGARAQYKGTGTINGSGSYKFMLTAIDGQVNGGGGTDKFRMKIMNAEGGGVIYDNQMGGNDNGNPTTVIGGGSIVIHSN